MKNIRKIILMLIVFVSLFASIGVVNAKTAPKTLKMKAKSDLYYFSGDTDYISGYNFYRKQFTNGVYGYCVSNINTKVPGGMKLTANGPITDKGLDYIIKNGWPNKTFTGDNKKDYYITQSAIWKYFDDTRGSKNWKGTSFTANSKGMKAHVYNLVTAAKVANEQEEVKPSIKVNVSSTIMNLNSEKTHFVSGEIGVTLVSTRGTYDVILESAPEGTVLKNTNGEVKTQFNDGENFVIYVPASSIKENEKGTVTIKVHATGVTYVTYSYTSGKSGYQKITPTETYEEETDLTSTPITLEYTKPKTTVTKVKISKQDIASKEELPGASLEIKDKDGKVVEKWVSTNEPHYVEGLAAGNYTLTETQAPDGYILTKESIPFTVREDGTVTSVIMYNTKEEVKVTKVKISKQDIASKEELPGASLEIKDKDGKVVEKWVSTNEPHYVEGLVAGKYTLTETQAPDGYILSTETISFEVKADGSVTSVIMYNTKDTKTTKVKISKQDITSKKELPGATLTIKDKEGNVVKEWVSTNEPYYIEGLTPGEYTLTEKIAPEGYTLSSETISFTVEEDGTMTSVVMYNAPQTEVPITDMNVSPMIMIIASVLMTLGTGMVVYYVKFGK